jgi:putative transcriptional regulator
MPKKAADRKSAFGADLIEGIRLVAAHQRGEIDLEQVWPKPIDVKAIRKRLKMSQAEFSSAYGISKRGLQEWEQGGRQPDSAARLSHRHCERAGGRAPRACERLRAPGAETGPKRRYVEM